jgi:hypothetical protein
MLGRADPPNSNNLAGSISQTLVDPTTYAPPVALRQLEFYHLQAVSMESNQLSGRFPIWLTQLPNLHAMRMASNTFQLNSNDETAFAAYCDQPSVNCTGSGLPGQGGTCLAFGRNVALIHPQDQRCALCASSDSVSSQWYALLLLPLLVLFGVYAYLVYQYAQGGRGCTVIKQCAEQHATNLKGWVACSCVLSLHLQTIMLVGAVRPFWPSHIQRFLGMRSLRRPPAQWCTRHSSTPLSSTPPLLCRSPLLLHYSMEHPFSSTRLALTLVFWHPCPMVRSVPLL